MPIGGVPRLQNELSKLRVARQIGKTATQAANRFLGIDERFLLGVTFRHHFRQGRNEYGEPTLFLWFRMIEKL